MVIFKDVNFEIFEFLGAEGASVVSVDGLLDAVFAVDMSASGDVAVGDGVEADGALELVLEILGGYSETVVVEVGVVGLDLHWRDVVFNSFLLQIL